MNEQGHGGSRIVKRTSSLWDGSFVLRVVVLVAHEENLPGLGPDELDQR